MDQQGVARALAQVQEIESKLTEAMNERKKIAEFDRKRTLYYEKTISTLKGELDLVNTAMES